MDPKALFLSGDLSDLTIRVHSAAPAIPPPSSSSSSAAAAAAATEEEGVDAARPAKRERFSGGGKGEETAEEAKAEGQLKEDKKDEKEAAAAGTVHVIRAHSFPLVTSSSYFAAIMAEKRWKEGVERVLDVTLSGGQALEDFKLLLQGAYTRSFFWAEEEGLHFGAHPAARDGGCVRFRGSDGRLRAGLGAADAPALLVHRRGRGLHHHPRAPPRPALAPHVRPPPRRHPCQGAGQQVEHAERPNFPPHQHHPPNPPPDPVTQPAA